MQKFTDAQKRRRRDAILSVLFYETVEFVSAFVILLVRHQSGITGIWSTLMLLFALLDLGMSIPTYIILKQRLKEIQGGEEDAAAQY